MTYIIFNETLPSQKYLCINVRLRLRTKNKWFQVKLKIYHLENYETRFKWSILTSNNKFNCMKRFKKKIHWFKLINDLICNNLVIIIRVLRILSYPVPQIEMTPPINSKGTSYKIDTILCNFVYARERNTNGLAIVCSDLSAYARLSNSNSDTSNERELPFSGRETFKRGRRFHRPRERKLLG